MLRDAQLAHCVMFSDLGSLAESDRVEIAGDEAHHAARVKRLRPGERVGLIGEQGAYAFGTLESVGGSRSKPVLNIDLEQVGREEPISPTLEVWAALPKGDRLDRMIDQLTQLGVSGFRPLICDHAQRKIETYRPDKLNRIMEEAMKQCRRVWPLIIGEPLHFADAIRDPDAVIADASGHPWAPQGDKTAHHALIVGPEGGWSNTEREQFVEPSVPVHRFGQLVMRIETAAVAAAATIMGTA